MDDDQHDSGPIERISLLGSLEQDWLKLPFDAMCDVGPATQTLAGLLKITNRETFVQIEEISRRSRLPVSTVRKHMSKLDETGWVKNKGRQRMSGGRLRRTATIAVTAKTREALEPYGVLPWWASCHARNGGKLSWSSRAVLSVVMARLMRLKAVVVEREEYMPGDDEFADVLIDLLGDDRFKFGLDDLRAKTGLDRKSIIKAKKQLNQKRIVHWNGTSRSHVATTTDELIPNWDFAAVVTPSSPGRIWIDFESG